MQILTNEIPKYDPKLPIEWDPRFPIVLNGNHPLPDSDGEVNNF